MLERDEGRVKHAYPDALTHGAPWTVGVGHCGPEVQCDTVWTDEQIDAAFKVDVAEARNGCLRHMPWLSRLSAPRVAVVVAMAFQMGLHGLLGFIGMLAALKAGKYAEAAHHMHNSLWARQTPIRAARMAAQLETGRWV